MSYDHIRQQHGIDVSVNQLVQSRITSRYGHVRPEGVKKDYVRVQFVGDSYQQNCRPDELDFDVAFGQAG